jgi:hypothetical protein
LIFLSVFEGFFQGSAPFLFLQKGGGDFERGVSEKVCQAGNKEISRKFQ